MLPGWASSLTGSSRRSVRSTSCCPWLFFCAFGLMFFKMSIKHTKRIKGYQEEFRPVWHFFDLKAYIIMAVMMGGGIWLRASGLVPDVFIAVFYTGLGCALALAGVLFWIMFLLYHRKKIIGS